MKSVSILLPLIVLLSSCGGSPESEAPIAIKPGLYEVVHTGGVPNFETSQYCVRESAINDFPHDLTERLIITSGEYPEGCSWTAGERKGNATTTTHSCPVNGGDPDSLDNELVFHSTITGEGALIERSSAMKSRQGASEAAVAGAKEFNDAYDRSGPTSFTITRKGDC